MGVWSSLKSPVWTTVPAGVFEEHAERAGNGVRGREELDGEAPEVDVATALDLAKLGRADAELRKLALDEAQGEFAREDRHLVVEVLEQIRQGARVVLVAVRDDDAAQLVLVFQHIGVVGQHQVDAGLVVVGGT